MLAAMRWSLVALVLAACGGQVASRPVAVTVAPSYLFGKVDTWRDFRIKQTCCSGVGVGGHVGLRVLDDLTFGLQLSMASLDGYYLVDFNRTRVPMHVNPMNVAAGLHVTPYERYWATLFLGAHFNRATIPSTRPDPVEEYAWHHGLAVGFQLGADLVRVRCHGGGVAAWFSGGLGSANGYGEVGVGLSYRYSLSHR